MEDLLKAMTRFLLQQVLQMENFLSGVQFKGGPMDTQQLIPLLCVQNQAQFALLKVDIVWQRNLI